MTSGPYKEAKHKDIYFAPSLHHHPAAGLLAPPRGSPLPLRCKLQGSSFPAWTGILEMAPTSRCDPPAGACLQLVQL